MEKVKLIKDPHGDSRHASKDTTFEEFHLANVRHISDVKRVLYLFSKLLEEQADKHDWTKLTYEKEFWEDFWKEDFVHQWWYQMHVQDERHHPLSYCHDDINLLDILEMIVDCVVAGKARAGEVRPLEINDEILKKAFENTVKLVDDNTEVVEEDFPGEVLDDDDYDNLEPDPENFDSDDLPWDFDEAPTDDELDWYDLFDGYAGYKDDNK